MKSGLPNLISGALTAIRTGNAQGNIDYSEANRAVISPDEFREMTVKGLRDTAAK